MTASEAPTPRNITVTKGIPHASTDFLSSRPQLETFLSIKRSTVACQKFEAQRYFFVKFKIFFGQFHIIPYTCTHLVYLKHTESVSSQTSRDALCDWVSLNYATHSTSSSGIHGASQASGVGISVTQSISRGSSLGNELETYLK